MASLPVCDGVLQIFDVEHGACALLTVPGPSGFMRILIDCGHNASAKWYPGEHLQRLGVTRLQLLAVTNYDEDHVSGYPNLLQQGIGFDWLLRNPTVTPANIQRLKTEDGMGPGIAALVRTLGAFGPAAPGFTPPVFPGVEIEWFFNPYPHFDDENNLSLVLMLKVLGFTFLFPGDMECRGFNNMLNTNARFRSVVAAVDVLIASHHGRENGICPDMFEVWRCQPKVVVISDDCKRYATQETVAFYGSKARGIQGFRVPGTRKLLTTRTDGEITFTFTKGNCVVN